MGITISHDSALFATRKLRAAGLDLRSMDVSTIAHPAPWLRSRWSAREFASDDWKWGAPSLSSPLHIVVSRKSDRLRMKHVKCHVCSVALPANAVLWLDGKATMSSPPLLFVQMAETLSLPELVMFGYELCGNFTRSAEKPLGGPITDKIGAATSICELRSFVESVENVAGLQKARAALAYIADHAVSAPEAVLGTMYSLPPEESGYGMGPITLNQRVDIDDGYKTRTARSRYPDLMFSFGPLGLNYDGEAHLNLRGLTQISLRLALTSDGDVMETKRDLDLKCREIRQKVVDDIRRNRQLMSTGRVVLPATKEDLQDIDSLDDLTREILQCASSILGIGVEPYERTLNDSELARSRGALLEALLPFRGTGLTYTLKT